MRSAILGNHLKKIMKVENIITIIFVHSGDMHTLKSSVHQVIKMLIPVGWRILKCHSNKLQIRQTFNIENFIRRGKSCSSFHDKFLGFTQIEFHSILHCPGFNIFYLPRGIVIDIRSNGYATSNVICIFSHQDLLKIFSEVGIISLTMIVKSTGPRTGT